MEEVQGETGKRQASSSLDDGSDNILCSLNFNPRLFMNDVRNAVDDVIDEGFVFFKEQAQKVIGVKDNEVAEKISKAIDGVHYTVQVKLEKQLDNWETYCTMHCFDIPKGLSFTDMNYPKDSPESSCEDRSSDVDLDSQLECLREMLVVAGRESAVLRGELTNLERQATVTIRHAEALDNALQPLEENSTQDVINEFIRAASVLFGEKMEWLKTQRRDKMENQHIMRIRSPNVFNNKRKDFPGIEASVEDMQQFVNNFNGIHQS